MIAIDLLCCRLDGWISLTGTVASTDTSRPISTRTMFGVNPIFNFNCDCSTSTPLLSPLLLRSTEDTYMRFRFTAENKSSTATVTVKLQQTVLCFSDLRGNSKHSKSFSQTYEIDLQQSSAEQCLKVIDVKDLPAECQTFQIQLELNVEDGIFSLGDIEYGSGDICSFAPLQNYQGCDFQSGDCGIKNDGCGRTAWEIRPDVQPQDSTSSEKLDGFPLPKRLSTTACSYDLSISLLKQQSGVNACTNPATYPYTSTPSYRRKRQSGSALYLDPLVIGNVVQGTLDLPDVVHGSENAVITFQVDMVEDGLHDLVVTAVCTSNPNNQLVPLDQYSVHFHKSNFDGNGVYTKVCLDIHSYVSSQECSTFTIRMTGAALSTFLSVDTIFFSTSLSAASCSK